MRIRKVVIPVAGLGTRGLPFTKELPKEMVPLVDTPAVHFIVEEAVEAGIEQVIFVTGKGKSALEDYFDASPALEAVLRERGKDRLADSVARIGQMARVMSVRQKEPKGLGHAVLCARDLVGDEPFAVCLGDEVFPHWGNEGGERGLKKLVRCAEETAKSVVAVLAVPHEEVSNYGIIDMGDHSPKAGAPIPVLRTVEKPRSGAAPSRYAMIGRYVFQPGIFDKLQSVQPGVGGEIQLTDAMDQLAREGTLLGLAVGGARYDVGNPLYYVLAQVDAAMQRPELAAPLRALLRERLNIQ